MKRLVKISCLLLFLAYSWSCKQDDNDVTIQKKDISGFVQKGPFVNGTNITVSELTDELAQTGKTFTSQIEDDKGSFTLGQIQLESNFVELKADGFYYNENSGSTSGAQLTLFALSNLTDKSTLNVNIMSHLERNRVNYLIANGSTFEEAKDQAQQEILGIFGFEKNDIPDSELLDISQGGDDNAILLAISVISLGFRSDADFSELLANISTDIREDGVLTDPALGTALINDAVFLDPEQIRENLESRYTEVGVDANIADFEKYIQTFIDDTEYEFTKLIEYPEFSEYGENLLFLEKDSFYVSKEIPLSLSAILPVGASLKVVVSEGSLSWHAGFDGPVNWDVSNELIPTLEFTSIESGTECDVKLSFDGFYVPSPSDTLVNPTVEAASDTIKIDYYENASAEATRSRSVIVHGLKY